MTTPARQDSFEAGGSVKLLSIVGARAQFIKAAALQRKTNAF